MRKILFIIAMILLFAAAGYFAFPELHGAEVPGITPSDFGGAATTTPNYAAWYWQIIRYDSIAAAIWTGVAWVITKISITIRDQLIKRQAYKAAEVSVRVFDWCLVAAEDTWATLTRALKAEDGGKLTDDHKNESRDAAVERAWELIQNDGMAHLKGVSKDALPYLIDQAVKYLKAKGKAAKAGNLLEAVPPPLPDLSPLLSSVMPTARQGLISAVSG